MGQRRDSGKIGVTAEAEDTQLVRTIMFRSPRKQAIEGIAGEMAVGCIIQIQHPRIVEVCGIDCAIVRDKQGRGYSSHY